MKQSNSLNLKTIADRAGVSTATVSNVINGNYHKVSEKTVERVNQIIEELNYSPNAAARSLVSNESKIIVLLVPNMMVEGGFGVDPYATQMISNLEQIIRNEGYYMMLQSVNRVSDILQVVHTWNADGIIILGAYSEEIEEIGHQLDNIPVVYTDTYSLSFPITNIGIDDYKGGYLSAKYLLDNGHRKIAFIGPDVNTSSVIQQRFLGYKAALEEYGLSADPEDIHFAETTIEDGVMIAKKIAASDRGYTAVSAMSDTIAVGLCSELQNLGISIPEDISVIGFDDIKASTFVHPALTTVAQDLNEKATLVGKHLFEMVRTKKFNPVNEIMDVKIIERQSVRKLS